MSVATHTHEQVGRWKPATRLAFRFSVVYLGLYSLSTQIAGSLFVIPFVSFRGFGMLWPMRNITLWIGEHIFRFDTPLSYAGNSRDAEFFWIQTLWIFIL